MGHPAVPETERSAMERRDARDAEHAHDVPPHLRERSRGPRSRKMVMHLSISLDADSVQVGARVVQRPLCVSRSRWIAFWRSLEYRGITEETFTEMRELMTRVRGAE